MIHPLFRVNLALGFALAVVEPGRPLGPGPSALTFVNRSRNLEMKKLLAAMIAASFACGVAYAADAPKDAKKPTADECKKAAEAKKELAGCDKMKDAPKK